MPEKHIEYTTARGGLIPKVTAKQITAKQMTDLAMERKKVKIITAEGSKLPTYPIDK